MSIRLASAPILPLSLAARSDSERTPSQQSFPTSTTPAQFKGHPAYPKRVKDTCPKCLIKRLLTFQGRFRWRLLAPGSATSGPSRLDWLKPKPLIANLIDDS